MVDQTVTADICSKMVEAATRSCQPMISVPPEPAISNADGLAALSTAFVYGSILLAILVVIAGYSWARSVAREAKDMAEKEVKNWIKEEGLPLILREVNEFLQTFPKETPISENDVAAMVAAAGSDGEEGKDGKK